MMFATIRVTATLSLYPVISLPQCAPSDSLAKLPSAMFPCTFATFAHLGGRGTSQRSVIWLSLLSSLFWRQLAYMTLLVEALQGRPCRADVPYWRNVSADGQRSCCPL